MNFPIQWGPPQIILFILGVIGLGLMVWSVTGLLGLGGKEKVLLEDDYGRRYRHYLHRRRHFGWGQATTGLIMLLIAIFFLGMAFAIQGYLGLTGEIKVARVHTTFLSQQDHKMIVEVILYDQNGSQVSDTPYQVLGDRWRLEGNILAFKPWMNLVGIHSGYKVTGLSGEFENRTLENYAYNDPMFHNNDGEFKKAMEINGGTGDFFKTVYKQAWSSPFIDSAYGNEVVEPADGMTYTIYASQDALKAKIEN